MGITTIVYPTCDRPKYGKPCGKELRTPKDGIVLVGRIYAGGPVSGNLTSPGHPPILGPEVGKNDPGSMVNAFCWDCFLEATQPPQLKELQDYISRSYKD